mgnify:CR=1 FL=1
MEAIVLAGGLGTRLRSVVYGLPKPMAPIENRPFMEYILKYLEKNGITRVILSVGYKWEIIKEYFGDKFRNIEMVYCVEEEPLGTGGAIKKALCFVESNEVFVLNGDTFFNINLDVLYNLHKKKDSKLSLALKKMEFTQRYGSVDIDANNKILSFNEKTERCSVFINGGIYLLNKDFFITLTTIRKKFSFEKDFLQEQFNNYEFYGFNFEEFFIDIGIPEDYEKAKKEFKYLTIT